MPAQEISYVREEVPGKDGFTCHKMHGNLAPVIIHSAVVLLSEHDI